jgi:type IV pilus assembly protein PilC
MTRFAYKARKQDGQAASGFMEASSRDDLARKLKGLGLAPTHIDEAAQDAAVRPARSIRARVSVTEMILFNTQLANLISAGITLLMSLKTIGQLVTNVRFKSVIKNLGDRIADGASFSEALIEHPKVFPRLFVSMVRAGEVGGRLSLVLHRYAEYVEQQEEIRQKIKNALLYPSLLLVFGTAVVIFILSFVIPKFVEIFLKSGIQLPFSTRILYDAGQFLRGQWLLLLALLIGAAAVCQVLKRLPASSRFLDGLELSWPVFGSLKRKIYFARFSRSLSTLLASGVPLLQSLETVKGLISNTVIAGAIDRGHKGVESGGALGKLLGESGVFPVDLVQMITVGEESGQLVMMLEKSADFYDAYVDHVIKRLIVLIEPVLIVIMAALVGLIMASVIIPLFDMIKTVHRY